MGVAYLLRRIACLINLSRRARYDGGNPHFCSLWLLLLPLLQLNEINSLSCEAASCSVLRLL